jgi:Tol biopolymer transport system component
VQVGKEPLKPEDRGIISILETLDVDSDKRTVLAEFGDTMEAPDWTGDGKFLIFNRPGLMQIWRMEADGSGPAQMSCDESNNWFPHVSPGGKRVVFISYRKEDVEPDKHPPNKNVQLRLMSAEGGEFRVIAELFGGQGTIYVNSWSPDSRTIAFVSYRLKNRT